MFQDNPLLAQLKEKLQPLTTPSARGVCEWSFSFSCASSGLSWNIIFTFRGVKLELSSALADQRIA
jgi:hypothetical protein